MKAAADHVRHLIDQGDALAARDDMRSALSFYRAALKAARDEGAIPAVLVPELKRVLEISQAQAVDYEAHLQDGLRSAGYHPQTSSDRFTLSLDLMAGRKRLFFQQPRFYLFPGLPQIEFEARERVPWLAEVEAAGPTIRGELQALIADQAVFKPYVESRGNRPNGDQGGMLDNPDWSAIFLWKDGVEQPDIASRCPQTLRALAAVPLCKIPGRTPSILFSKLSAGARIPKHHGMVNVRLICHLPLITPQGCHLRVGNTVREWRDGEAWAFDDTVEHEARNDSDEDRIILIFDVWKNEVSDEERGLIANLFQAIDAYDRPSAAWGV